MKRIINLLLIALSVFCVLFINACGKKVVEEGKLVSPLYTEIDMKNLPDGIYYVGFERQDIEEKDGDIYINANIYSEDIYDTVEIHSLKVGDTIFRNGRMEKIDKIIWDEQQSKCCINFDSLDDAVEMIVPNESGGTYYISGPDDHHTYTLRGKSKIKLAKSCILSDDSDWDNPGIKKNYKEIVNHITSAEFDYYICLNTTIRMENGEAVEINRRYIP